MTSTYEPANGIPPNARLNGWKEIASYIGRGVRTAQRWERELGMPVHRLNTGAGDVVFANPAELDDWLRRQSSGDLAPAAVGRDDAHADNIGSGTASHAGNTEAGAAGRALQRAAAARWWVGLTVVAAAATAAFTGWSLAGGTGPAAPPPLLAQPASVVPSGDTLSVLGPKQELLWQHRFAAPLVEHSPEFPSLFRRSWNIRDFDNDGSSEVLFARTHSADPRIYCFNRDGSVRFARSIDTRVRFGPYACPPVMLTHVIAEQRPDFPRTFFVVGQHPLYFPAVVRRFDAEGNAAGEYWSNGFIRVVESVEIGGRQATLIGATNNETGGASLAVFFGNIGGSAPAARAEYRCEGCAAGAPDVFLVFPRSRLQEELSHNSTIHAIEVIGQDRLSISVVTAGQPDTGQPCCGMAYYTLDKDFRIVSTELGASFGPLQRQLEAERRVTEATRFRDPADFYPVRRWNGSGWDLITSPGNPDRR